MSPEGQPPEGQPLEGQSPQGQPPGGRSRKSRTSIVPRTSCFRTPRSSWRRSPCLPGWSLTGTLTQITSWPGRLAGCSTVRTKEAAWVLPPTRALWIPAGLRHETLSDGAATMRSAYLRPGLCPITWTEPTPVMASPLLAELIGYLEASDLDPDRRARAEAVLVDLLQPVAMTTIELRKPADDPARLVADQLAADPADGRTLAQWGREVGASERTLARAFLAGTGDELRPVADAAPAAGGFAGAGGWRAGRQRGTARGL